MMVIISTGSLRAGCSLAYRKPRIMNRSKVVAIVTGALSLLLAIGYLVLVQLLDFRGEMVPAPIGLLLS